MPVKPLVEVCHKHDVIVLIDGAHAPGQLSFDIQDINADFYTGNGICDRKSKNRVKKIT